VKSRESHRTVALPTVVVRTFERHRIAQAERRLAAGLQWQRSDFVFTTGARRPLRRYAGHSRSETDCGADIDGWPAGLCAHSSPWSCLSRLRRDPASAGFVPRFAPFVRLPAPGRWCAGA
jgi:hypothetical protein